MKLHPTQANSAEMLARTLLGAIVAWCIAHLFLSGGEGFNPWKLGGFGMFSVPDPTRTHVGLVLIEDSRSINRSSDPISRLGFRWWEGEASRAFFDVTVLTRSGPRTMPVEQYLAGTPELRKLLLRIQILRRKADLHELAEKFLQALPREQVVMGALVLLTQPRVDVDSGTLYGESCLYHLGKEKGGAGLRIEADGCFDVRGAAFKETLGEFGL